MKTYTEHKLTDAQLRRLSVICNDAKGARAGMARVALERKGLVTEIKQEGTPYNWTKTVATDAGRAALTQARREGW